MFVPCDRTHGWNEGRCKIDDLCDHCKEILRLREELAVAKEKLRRQSNSPDMIVKVAMWNQMIERAEAAEQREREALEELADINEAHRITMSEQCPTDEVHCTCVPALRREIARLRDELHDWKINVEIFRRESISLREELAAMTEDRDRCLKTYRESESFVAKLQNDLRDSRQRECETLRLFLKFYRHVLFMYRLTDNENDAIRDLVSRAREQEVKPFNRTHTPIKGTTMTTIEEHHRKLNAQRDALIDDLHAAVQLMTNAETTLDDDGDPSFVRNENTKLHGIVTVISAETPATKDVETRLYVMGSPAVVRETITMMTKWLIDTHGGKGAEMALLAHKVGVIRTLNDKLKAVVDKINKRAEETENEITKDEETE